MAASAPSRASAKDLVMPVVVTCPNPNCAKSYRVREENLGSQAQCKSCGQHFTLQMKNDETSRRVAQQPGAPEAFQSLALVGGSPADPADRKSSSMTSRRQPSKIGPFEIRGRLGSGAMGEVWRGWDPELDRPVAIKTVRAEHGGDPDYLQRFLREARNAAKLHHTNTVTIYQVGSDGELVYIAMELVDGESLDRTIKNQQPLDWREATRVIRDAAAGLAAAHEEGLVHRDIKPSNLMRAHSGVTKVVDFGLSRARAASVQLTQQGMILGTPAYMAPELWKGKEADVRSDLYSLICTYYCLLTGRAPFEATEIPALGFQHYSEPLPDPRPSAAGLPDGICRILAKGAAKDPDDRYQSAADLLGELNALLASPQDCMSFGSPFPSMKLPVHGAAPPPPPPPSIVIKPRIIKRHKEAWLHRTRQRLQERFGARVPPTWLAIAAAGAAALIMCGIVFLVRTPNGTVKIDLIDPPADVQVAVDGNTIDIKGLDDPLKFKVGEHQLQVTSPGFETYTQEFTVRRNDTPILRVELERLIPRPSLAVAPFDAATAKKHQTDWAAYLKAPAEITNSIGMKLALIPPGEFFMGSPPSEAGRGTDEVLHRVRLTNPFYISVFEVTQRQYEAVMSENPSGFKGEDRPVERLNWDQAKTFCEALSQREGAGRCYRLATEAEWEFACRAGTTSPFAIGDTSTSRTSVTRTFLNETAIVGSGKPNPFGLWDMHANVWEWCEDWYGDFSAAEQTDPTGPDSGSDRVVRGGWHGDGENQVGSAERAMFIPGLTIDDVGFRVVLDASESGGPERPDDINPPEPPIPPVPRDTPDRRAAEWLLSLGGVTLDIIVDGGSRTARSAEDLPNSDFDLVGVGADFAANKDDTLIDRLRGLESIEILSLWGWGKGDPKHRMQVIGTLRSLKDLVIGFSPITDDSLAPISQLTDLESLYLEGTPITDDGLKHLQQLTRLKVLLIASTKIGDQGVRALRSLQQLETLSLANTSITDAAIPALSVFPALEQVSLQRTKITNEGLVALNQLPALRRISLAETAISDDGIDHLCKLSQLERVDLRTTKVTDAGLAKLRAALPKCEFGELIVPDFNKNWKRPPAALKKGPRTTVAPKPAPEATPAGASQPGSSPAKTEASKESLTIPREFGPTATSLPAPPPVEPIALKGHTGPVWSVAFTPDGKELLSASADCTIRIWDVATGAEVDRLVGHDQIVTRLAISPDGRFVFSDSEGTNFVGEAILWDLASKKIVKRIPHDDAHEWVRLAFSPDSRTFILNRRSGGTGGTHALVQWDTASGEERTRIVPSNPITALAYLPDGKRLLCGERDGSVHVLELESQQDIWQTKIHTEGVFDIAASRDGRTGASVSSDGTIAFWDLEQGKAYARENAGDGWIVALALSVDGRLAVSGTREWINHDRNSVRLWDVRAGKEIACLQRDHPLWGAALSPDGRYAALASYDGNVYLWPLTAEAPRPVPNPAATLTTKIPPRILESNGNVRVFQGHTGPVKAVAFAKDGKQILSGGADCSIRIWDLATGIENDRLLGAENMVNYLTLSPDGKTLLSAAGTCTVGGQVISWNLEEKTQRRAIFGYQTGSEWYTIRYFPDGRRLVSTGSLTSHENRDHVRLYEFDTFNELQRFEPNLVRGRGVAICPDGKRLFCGDGSNGVRLVDIEAGKEIWHTPGHDQQVTDVAVVASGRTGISIANDGALCVWDLATGQRTVRLQKDNCCLAALAVSPDGGRAITGTCDSTNLDRNAVRLWDLRKGEEVALVSCPREVRSAAFSPDGRDVAFACMDRGVYVWRLPEN
jgi:WD40 repeat protein/serine/threonine protein kinase/formylglycine-generating enzyme required for sulfatase activity